MNLIYLFALVVLVLLGGNLYQRWSTQLDKERFPPLGKLINMGGYNLHLYANGNGNPTVVLDAGLSGTSLGWSLIQPEVAQFTRVCSYDRAGYGFSESSPHTRTSIHIAKELHALLKKAGILGPYILVGHSFGGANMLLFADLYPKEVLGVILVDSVHEDMPEEPYSIYDALNAKFQWFLSIIGYKRLRGPSKEIQAMFQPLSENIRNAYIAEVNKTNYTQTVQKEYASFKESLSQMQSVHLGNIPLVVITAGRLPEGEEGQVWQSCQRKLLLKSSNSKQIIAENSDHMINHYQPQIIVKAIRKMILEA